MAIARRQATVTLRRQTGPATVIQPPVAGASSLAGVLAEIVGPEGEPALKPEEITQLLALRLRDGTPLFEASDKLFAGQIVGQIAQLGFARVYNTLGNHATRTDAFLATPGMELPRITSASRDEGYRRKVEHVEGVFTCPRPTCRSQEVQASFSQDRRSDEPMTTHLVCAVCNTQWRM